MWTGQSAMLGYDVVSHHALMSAVYSAQGGPDLISCRGTELRVLVVEDDPSIAQFLRQGLHEAGFGVDVAVDGEEGEEHTLAIEYDAIILDILLPKRDGLSLLRRIRERGIKTPIVLLTARDTVEDRVRGLNSGADDYLVKPFAFLELLARLRALLRRPPITADTLMRVGELEMDLLKREVRRSGRLVDLTPKEFALLEYLMRHPSQVLTRSQIADRVWGRDFYSESNVVDVYVGYLRRKITGGDGHPLIQTVRGVGYRMSEQDADG